MAWQGRSKCMQQQATGPGAAQGGYQGAKKALEGRQSPGLAGPPVTWPLGGLSQWWLVAGALQ